MVADPRSVLTRPSAPPDFTVHYGDLPDQLAEVRVGGPPLLIFIHGGFWRHEYDRGHVGPLAAALAARGITVATPEYRRTGGPGGGWPGTFDDVAAALRLVPALVAARTGRVGPVALGGHSAGGHLALWAASRAPAEVRTQVRGVVALAPVADLALADELDLDGGAVRDLLAGGAAARPQRYADASPRVPVGVPVLLLHGDQDQQVPLELSRRFARRARVPLRIVPGAEHFALIDPQSSAWPTVLAAVRTALGLATEFDGTDDSG